MRRPMVWYLLLVTAVICCVLAAGYLRRAADPENAVLARREAGYSAPESGKGDEWLTFYI